MQQLKDATGVFFSGGDQNRIMDVLADHGLLGLLKQKYGSGTPFGGTSAEAAVSQSSFWLGSKESANAGYRHRREDGRSHRRQSTAYRRRGDAGYVDRCPRA
ncbi:MAG: Type 1 glutamine amidotransferase-like domain-containing protein [Pyrinomonadaceae bacterium]